MNTEPTKFESRLPPDLQGYFDDMQETQRNQGVIWSHTQVQNMLHRGIPLEMIIEAIDEYHQAMAEEYRASVTKPRGHEHANKLTRRRVLGLLGIGAAALGVGAVMGNSVDCGTAIRPPTRKTAEEEHTILRELLENQNLCGIIQRATVEIWTGKKRGIAYIAGPSTLVSSAHLFQDNKGEYDTTTIKSITTVKAIDHGSVKTATAWEPDTARYASAYDEIRDIIVIKFDKDIFKEGGRLPFAADAECTGIALKSNMDWHVNGGILTRIEKDARKENIYMHAETTPGSSGGLVATHNMYLIGLAVSDAKTQRGVSTTKVARITQAIISDLETVAEDRLKTPQK